MHTLTHVHMHLHTHLPTNSSRAGGDKGTVLDFLNWRELLVCCYNAVALSFVVLA